ncbi:MAG TPA: hypothetical protein VJH69_00095 [Candidatus Paceibacterota bacterium]
MKARDVLGWIDSIFWLITDLWKLARRSPSLAGMRHDVAWIAGVGSVLVIVFAVGIHTEIRWLWIVAVVAFLICGFFRALVDGGKALAHREKLRQEADE